MEWTSTEGKKKKKELDEVKVILSGRNIIVRVSIKKEEETNEPALWQHLSFIPIYVFVGWAMIWRGLWAM